MSEQYPYLDVHLLGFFFTVGCTDGWLHDLVARLLAIGSQCALWRPAYGFASEKQGRPRHPAGAATSGAREAQEAGAASKEREPAASIEAGCARANRRA